VQRRALRPGCACRAIEQRVRFAYSTGARVRQRAEEQPLRVVARLGFAERVARVPRRAAVEVRADAFAQPRFSVAHGRAATSARRARQNFTSLVSRNSSGRPSMRRAASARCARASPMPDAAAAMSA
jgi:hypothetical protein